MAVIPSNKKTASQKPTEKPAKSVAPAKKTASTDAKKPAPAKKATPAKAAAPAKKATPAKASAPAKSTAATKAPAPAKKPTPPKVAPAPAQVAIPAKPSKSAAAAKPAVAETKPQPAPAAPVVKKSSLIDFPVPPAPVRPKFIPPTKDHKVTSLEPVTDAHTGAHHSEAFVQKQRQRLLDLRDDLVDAMSGMTRDTIRNAPEGSEASGSGQHQGDAGSDAYDRDFALSVLAKEQDALYEIEQALRRIQLGTYGICEISARKIPQARLEVIPFARLTVECQAQWEKEYGKRRFRPSTEVGFSGGNYIEDEDSDAVSLDDDEE